jgi:hypothetical protein
VLSLNRQDRAWPAYLQISGEDLRCVLERERHAIIGAFGREIRPWDGKPRWHPRRLAATETHRSGMRPYKRWAARSWEAEDDTLEGTVSSSTGRVVLAFADNETKAGSGHGLHHPEPRPQQGLAYNPMDASRAPTNRRCTHLHEIVTRAHRRYSNRQRCDVGGPSSPSSTITGARGLPSTPPGKASDFDAAEPRALTRSSRT